ncbi:hypothetical protein [Parasutterella excrementihominis]|uniref:hypothetical protein n=1 Tax=Parasutterella excrementihominis TaxID=487175 RepID=UPI0024300C7E|nr:hypothetical protein [Parasutterella excrementihominis]
MTAEKDEIKGAYEAGYEAGVKAAKESAYARGYQAGYNDVIQREIQSHQSYFKRYVLEADK